MLGIGGGVGLTVVFSLAAWFFMGVTDDTEGAVRASVATPTPTPAPVDRAPGVSDNSILFGQSAAFTGPAQELGKNMRRGIEAAFFEANQAGGVHGRMLELLSLDDAYEPEAAIANTLQLIEQDSVFALIGAVGTPTSRSAVPVADARGVPYIAPFTGAAILRDPKWSTVINLRASYNQETEEMVAQLTEHLGIERIGIMYQDDSYGRAGYTGTRDALERRGMAPAAVGLYTRNTLAVKTALLDLDQGDPEAVVIIGAYQPVAELIKWARFTRMDPIFMTVSFVGSNALAAELGPAGEEGPGGEGVFVTQVVPFPTDDSIPIVAAYLKALDAHGSGVAPGFVSLEGYIAGRLTIAALELCGQAPDRDCFLETLQGDSLTDIDGFDLRFGPQDNQGSDQVFLTVIGADARYYSIDSLEEVRR